MKINKLFLLFLMLFIIPIVAANTNYNESGNFDINYQLGTGIFNLNLDPVADISVAVRTVTNPRNIPLVSDLDNDGINEIIVIDLPLIRLLEPVTLDTVAGFNTGKTERISNVITFDIDDDNLTEIIFVFEESEILSIFEFNGTSLYNQSNISLTNLSNTVDSEFMIKCGKPENCILVWDGDIKATSGSFLAMIGFNSTNTSVSGQTTIEDSVLTNDNYCFPKIRSIAYADYDIDGTSEYIFSAMKLKRNDNEEIKILYVDVLDNLAITTEFERSITSCGEDGINPHYNEDPQCDTIVASTELLSENLFTSPLVFDAEDESDGLETIIGVSTDADEYKICSYYNPSVNIEEMDDYPEIAEADGFLLSNPFRANAILGSGNNDFCVMGYDEDDLELEVICANERDTGSLTEDTEYKFSTAGNINITVETYRKQSIIAHSAQHSTATTEGENLHEIVSSYGIFSLDPDTIFEIQGLVLIKTMNLIFNNPRDNSKGDDGSMISVDAEMLNIEGGSEDLIFMNSNNIYYFDDGRTNTPAVITEYTVNPCLDSVWKVNTSVQVTVTVVDADDDLVSANVILYRDSTNEMNNNWSANVSSGTEIPFDFTANKTIGTGNLRLRGRDVENPLVVDEIDLTFAVGLYGVEFGDCTTSVVITPEDEEEEEAEADLTTDAADNAITNALNTFINLTGLGGTTLWLFAMMVMTVLIWFEGIKIASGNAILGTIVIFDVIAVILGARLGIFSAGMIVTIAVIGVVILGVFLGKFLMGKESPA